MTPRIALLALIALVACVTLAAAQPSPPIFDVTAYGAVGDGQTDDTVAVAKAVTAMMLSPVGGVLTFPIGTFLLLQIPPSGSAYMEITTNAATVNASFNIVGSGAFGGEGNSTVIVYNATVAAAIIFNGVYGGSIEGVALVAYVPSDGGLSSTTVALNNVALFEIDGVLFSSYPNGTNVGITSIFIIGTSHTILIRNTVFNEVFTAAMLVGTTDVLFENVLFSGLTNLSAGELPIAVATLQNSDNIRFEHVKFQNFGVGVQFLNLAGPRGASFSDTAFYDISDVGVEILTGGTFSFSHCAFNVTNGGGIAGPHVGIVTNSAATGPLTVTVSNVAFINQNVGILQNSGSVYIGATLFDGCGFGFYSNVTNDVTPNVSSFELTHSLFESIVDYAVYVVNGGDSVLTDNTCQSAGMIMQVDCTRGGCVIDNNENCRIIQNEPSEKTPSTKVKKILPE